MRLCSFAAPDGPRPGVLVDDGTVLDLTELARDLGPAAPSGILGWIEAAPGELDRLLERADRDRAARPLADLTLLSPLGRPPRSPICVGANYREHIAESEAVVGDLALPDDPVYFTKDTRSICGPFDDIPVDPLVTSQLDWEVELAVIIGTAGRDIPRSSALAHVFGYAVLNDVSARDVQLSSSQWWKGKSLEGSSPLGPYLVTRDEVPDPQDLGLSCWVDGELKQQSTTGHMIHDVAAIIADLSRYLTLEPGDVISTGTPEGVGLARQPQEWLTPGALLESEITGLGRQANRIVKAGE
jgi:2,4-didehydro-3-deoxy-L-rhamnonate hydrolase